MTQFRHRVRYHEVDQQGFLFNGHYFVIADVAMTEFFRDLGWQYNQLNKLGVDPSVVHTTAHFSSPARFDDELEVNTACVRLGNSSFDLVTRMELRGTKVAVINVTYVNVDAQLGEARPIPQIVRTALEAVLRLETVTPG